MFFAFRNASGKEQHLSQFFQIGNGRALGRRNVIRDGRQRRSPGILEISRKACDLECGIDLEEQRFVLPIERVRVESQAEMRVLGSTVILPRSINLVVVAQTEVSLDEVAQR